MIIFMQAMNKENGMKNYKKILGAVCLMMAASAVQAAPAVKGEVPHEVVVDISEQTAKIYLNGKLDAVWPISSARSGKYTPRGSWSPNFLSKYHKSSLYNNAPMPFSIFFNGNIAIHGTDQVSRLGSPASAGCIRLSRENAKTLFERVERDGMKSFRISVVD
jgi:lipoprotein-anchoring transpeptidase ErfK/SrfK